MEARFTVAPERMPAIPREKMTDEQRKAADELAAGPRGEVKGPFIAFLRSPELMRRVQKVGEYIRFVCPIDKRLGEFAAIIGARAWSQQFEWWAHYRQALEAGLKKEIADAVAEGRRPDGMADDETLVYDTLTELIDTKGLSDTTYARAVAKFGEQGLIDLIAVVGYYTMLAMVMNVARTAPGGGTPLPLVALPVRAVPL
ncbi:MAG: carboxymuconolactone decarboxylase family protein [Burkholderiales bacterium]|nr:carboxymuconolactone decarboxylase family protein [Burkholderiales bacterium]